MDGTLLEQRVNSNILSKLGDYLFDTVNEFYKQNDSNSFPFRRHRLHYTVNKDEKMCNVWQDAPSIDWINLSPEKREINLFLEKNENVIVDALDCFQVGKVDEMNNGVENNTLTIKFPSRYYDATDRSSVPHKTNLKNLLERIAEKWNITRLSIEDEHLQYMRPLSQIYGDRITHLSLRNCWVNDYDTLSLKLNFRFPKLTHLELPMVHYSDGYRSVELLFNESDLSTTLFPFLEQVSFMINVGFVANTNIQQLERCLFSNQWKSWPIKNMTTFRHPKVMKKIDGTERRIDHIYLKFELRKEEKQPGYNQEFEFTFEDKDEKILYERECEEEALQDNEEFQEHIRREDSDKEIKKVKEVEVNVKEEKTSNCCIIL